MAGRGSRFALSAALMEDLNAANIGFALCPMLSMGAIEALDKHGSDELKRDYLPKIVSGEWPATMNLTEPQAGSDVGALKTRAEPNGDGSWRITGTKIFITYGEHDLTDQIIHMVLARTPGAPEGTRGHFAVPGAQAAARRIAQRPSLRVDRAQDGHPRLADLRDELWRRRRRHRLAGRAGEWRHGGDVHDDEQCAAECRPAGRRHRRARDAARGRLCDRAQAGTAQPAAGADRRASRCPADAAADARADDGRAGAGLLRFRAGRPRGAGRSAGRHCGRRC